MGLRLITPPTSVPVSLPELRKQIELADTDTTHDSQLARLAADATAMVERYTRRALMRQTWRLQTHPQFRIDLPRPPFLEMVSVKILGTDGVNYITMPATAYAVSQSNEPAVIRMIDSWPSWYEYEDRPVQIDYVAGYGDSPSSVPEEIRTAILQIVAFKFEFRGDIGMDIPLQIKAALSGLRSGTSAGFFNGRL